MIEHLDSADGALRAIHSRAGRIQSAKNPLFVNVELHEIRQLAFEAVEAIAKAKEAAKPWWRHWI